MKMEYTLRQSPTRPIQRVAPQTRIANQSDARLARAQKLASKERLLTRYLGTVGGLNKIAANLANPVRRKLDYKGIGRKFFVVELMEAGIPLIFDRDLPEVPCVKVGQNGTVNSVEMYGQRVNVQDFEIAGHPKIPYRELYVRRFRALDRAKDRLIEGMQLREDLYVLSLFAAAITANAALPASDNPPTPVDVSASTGLTREALRFGFAEIEDNRLIVGSVLMSAFGTAGLRGWQFADLDQVGMQEVRESGYLGRMWGADFFVTDQLADGLAYTLAQDKFVGWWPIRKDTDVIPADDPANLRLGFVGYELQGIVVHNTLGVNSITFDPAATVAPATPV
jgi:hypothetical protein